MKKRMLATAILFLVSYCSFSQSTGIGMTTPDTSAVLHIDYPVKGLLIPLMSAASINAIANPARGLMVYDSASRRLMVNMGTPAVRNWKSITSTSSWSLSGNSGINAAGHFIGTTDTKPLLFRPDYMRMGELNPLNGNISWGMRYFYSDDVPPGFSNVIIGTDALRLNNDRSRLIAIGDSSLLNNSHNVQASDQAVLNTAIGSKSLYANTTGSFNTAIGYRSMYAGVLGHANTATGVRSMPNNTHGYFNTAFGYEAQYANLHNYYITSIGEAALKNNVAGSEHTAIGYYALASNTIGDYNTAAGSLALASNTLGNFNAAIGYEALTSGAGTIYNTAVGSHAFLYNTNGFFGTAIGGQALKFNTFGNSNTALGNSALIGNGSGSDNTAIGTGAMYHNAGQKNTGIGFQALVNTTTAEYNTAIGHMAGWSHNLSWNNTLIGAGSNMSASGMYNGVAIGYNAVSDANSRVRIGNSSTSSIVGQVGYSTQSDGRYKKNIQEDVIGTAFIMKLRPVTYQMDITSLNKRWNIENDNNERWKTAVAEQEKTVFSGFIAQEVEQAAKQLGYSFSGVDKPGEDAVYALRYAEFVMPLVKAMQERQQMITELETGLSDLKKMNDNQRTVNEKLVKRIEELEVFLNVKK